MEILETDAVSDEIQHRLQEIRKDGVKLTLDDFGTGYCSYDRLLKGQIDLVKIDRSIIKDLPEAKPTTMVKAIVALTKTLGIKTIAEGVETEQQAGILKEIGCDMAQGYLFGRPAPLNLSTLSTVS
jgi:EAL domain-containing protein (putative c-di-GMP-specific phosphodiesterase class I)